MAKYYYDKYTVVPHYEAYYQPDTDTIFPINQNSTISAYGYWSCDSQTGILSVSGDKQVIVNTSNIGNGVYSLVTSVNKVVYSFINYVNGAFYENQRTYFSRKTGDIAGTYLETIIAEDGTYPTNGQSGSYWYVKGVITFPSLKIKVDSTLKTSVNGWVKIDGVLRNIDSIWTKVNGVLKKI